MQHTAIQIAEERGPNPMPRPYIVSVMGREGEMGEGRSPPTF